MEADKKAGTVKTVRDKSSSASEECIWNISDSNNAIKPPVPKLLGILKLA